MSIIALLTYEGLCVPAAQLQRKIGIAAYRDLLRQHSVSKQGKFGAPKRIECYKLIKIGERAIECLVLPRFSYPGLEASGAVIIDAKTKYQFGHRRIAAELQNELFDNQRLVVNYLMKNIYTPRNIEAGLASTILSMAAGQGKSFVGAGIIDETKARTLWIVPKVPLVEQLRADLEFMFGSGENIARDDTKSTIKIGEYNSKRDCSADDVTIIVINSACNEMPQFFAGYSLIIFDEIHMYCTGERKNIFWLANARCMLGLSATPARPDGFDLVMRRHVGDVIAAEDIEGYNAGESKFMLRVRKINYWGPRAYTQHLTHEATGKMFCNYMYAQFMEDKLRMAVICDEIWRLYSMKHWIYVFAAEIASLRATFTAFQSTISAMRGNSGVKETEDDIAAAPELINDTNMKMFTGGLKSREAKDIMETTRILFTTYGYTGTGVSDPKRSAIVFVTPQRANMLQIVPRVLRRGGDETIERCVVDLVDCATGLKKQFDGSEDEPGRLAAYTRLGAVIEEVTVNRRD